MTISAEIQTPFVGDGSSEFNAFRARLSDNFKLEGYEDVTGLKGNADPNFYTVLARMDLDQVQLVESSADYWINWAQTDDDPPQVAIVGIPMRDEEPSQARHDAMRAWQAGQGFTQDFIDQTTGAAPMGRSAGEIGETVKVAQRELPPGVPPYPYMLTIEVTREPGWQGKLGWRVELIDWEQDVAPAATALAVYAKPDCDTYQFTSGGFVETDGVWGATCPAGFEPGDEDIYFGLLYGAAPFACFTMRQGQETMRFIVNGEP